MRAAGGPWADLRPRVLSALVLLPVGLGCLWLGGWIWAALIAAGAVGLALEWARLCHAPAGPLAVLAAVAAGVTQAGWPDWALCALAAGALVLGWRERRAWPALGLPYIGLAAVALVWLRQVAGFEDVLFVLLVVWATDIGAYLVGRLLGGPKLAPAISPGKTWSGAAGGLLAAIVVGWLVAPGMAAVVLAAGLSVVAQGGDLAESAAKRHFGVKDSGHLIPGHGGLLDRLDGVLAAAPAAALVALAAGRGVGF